MRYLVQVNWIGQFAKAFIWIVLFLVQIALFADSLRMNDSFLWIVVFSFLAGVCLYMAIGAAINGGRAFAATFKVRYGWGREK